MGLGSATALNMIDMIGVGPFITMPLVLSAMGGPQAMLGWVAGALLAVCDGLVSAELGAAMPGSGGSYRYLSEIYGPQQMGTADFVSCLSGNFPSALRCPLPRDASGWRAMRLITGPAGNGVRRAHCGCAYPVGGPAASELDCDAGNRGGGRHLLFHGAAALSAHHGDRAAVENTCGLA